MKKGMSIDDVLAYEARVAQEKATKKKKTPKVVSPFCEIVSNLRTSAYYSPRYLADYSIITKKEAKHYHSLLKKVTKGIVYKDFKTGGSLHRDTGGPVVTSISTGIATGVVVGGMTLGPPGAAIGSLLGAVSSFGLIFPVSSIYTRTIGRKHKKFAKKLDDSFEELYTLTCKLEEQLDSFTFTNANLKNISSRKRKKLKDYVGWARRSFSNIKDAHTTYMRMKS